MSSHGRVSIGQTFTDWRDIPVNVPPCVYSLADARAPYTPRYLGSSAHLRDRFRSHCTKSGVILPAGDWKTSVRGSGSALLLRVVAVHRTERECRSAEWKIAQRWQRRGVLLLGRHVAPVWDRTKLYAGLGWPGAIRTLRQERPAA